MRRQSSCYKLTHITARWLISIYYCTPICNHILYCIYNIIMWFFFLSVCSNRISYVGATRDFVYDILFPFYRFDAIFAKRPDKVTKLRAVYSLLDLPHINVFAKCGRSNFQRRRLVRETLGGEYLTNDLTAIPIQGRS